VSVCAEFGRAQKMNATLAIVRGLPQKKSDVVFLANGFSECVEMNSGTPHGRIRVENGPRANFAWNEKTERIEPLPPAGL